MSQTERSDTSDLSTGRGHDRLHLTDESTPSRSVAINKPSEWWCRVCGARVTVTPDMDEVGHGYGCPRRPEKFAKNVAPTGQVARACPQCGELDGEHLDACSFEGYACPTCERDGFKSRRGMRYHHTTKHGERLKTRRCAGCQGFFAPDEQSDKFCEPDCYHASRFERVESECEECGDTIVDIPSRDRRFCSPACGSRGTADERRTGSWLVCDHCGEDFYRRPSDAGPYCSPECVHASLRNEEGGGSDE